MPGSPEELDDQIATALASWDELAREGCRVRFVRDPHSGRLRAELVTGGEEQWVTMRPRELLELATGLRASREPRTPSP